MSGREPMDELLGDLAATDGPPPDPRFVEQLDARLRVAHAQGVGAGRGPAAGARAWWRPVVGVAAALVVAIGVVGAVALRREAPTEVVMTVASDTSVFLEDGPVPGTSGLVLPDGARIVVGPDGEAVVDGVVLPAGSEAIVVDDRVTLIVVDADRAPADDEQRDPPPLSIPPSTRDQAATDDTADPDRQTDRTTSSTTTSTPEATDSRPVDSTTTTAGTDPTRPPTTRPATTTSAPTTTRSDRLVLTATPVDDGRIRLDWTVPADLAPAGWRVRALAGDREATLLAIRGGDARSATLERAQTDGRSVWIEAVDRAGRILAASDPISIG